jgi:hypothetical protein
MAPARQPIDSYYPGDNISNNLPVIGQLNPYTEEAFRMQNGRYGALGNDEPTDKSGGDPRYESEALFDLEKQDDSFGSGIFDAAGRTTQNTDMGVFASDYALPGFVAREVPFAISEDIVGSDGADVVMVPAGGVTFVEAGGRLRSPVRASSTAMTFSPTGRGRPFVNLTPQAEQVNPTRQWTRSLQKDVQTRSLQPDVRQVLLGRQNTTVPMVQGAALGELSSLADSPVKAILWGALLGVGVGFVVHTVKTRGRR